jgi:branched-chain amino acid transport system substrate-binding protein
VKRRTILGLLVLLIGALAFAAVGCGGDDDDGGGEAAPADTSGGGEQMEAPDLPPVSALPSASCTDIEYEGEGEPQVLVASDLPLQGSSRTQTLQMVAAIKQVLAQNDWKAGAVNVGYQSCDDATAQAGKWDPGKTSQNANAYAENQSVLGMIGTFNSGAAAIAIPVLNQAPGGGLAMISPANTYVCLTEGGPGCADDEPAKYYPTGNRNYTRVVANDAYQGAALAEFMQAQGTTKLYILNDKEAYGLGVAENVRNAAEFLGIEVVGFEAWDPKASNYEALMNKIKQTGADGVFLGGLIDENGAQVIKDKVKVLGDNETVKLYMPDGFTTQQTIDESGVQNTRGSFMSVAGVPVDEFTGAAEEFIAEFEPTLGGDPVDPYAVYAAQATQIMLDAIGNSGDYSRQGVIDAMYATQCTGCFLGDFSFNENGDPTLASGAVVGFTMYRGEEQLEVETVFSPQEDAVQAARGT